MLALPPASESSLLTGLIAVSCVLAGVSVLIWLGVFAVRVRRLRLAERDRAAEEELTGQVLDRLSGYAGAAPFAPLPDWKRQVLLRVLQGLIEQTKGRDQEQLVRVLRDAGFREQALNDSRAPEPRRRQLACEILGCFNDAESIARLQSAVADPDSAVRLSAARALVQGGHVTSLKQLIEQLRFPADDPSLILGEIVARAPPALLPEAASMLREPLPPDWLHMIAIALGRRQVFEAYPEIAGLRLSPNPRVRAAAWVALMELGDPRAAEIVQEGLRDPSPDVQISACRCAARVAGREALRPLAAQLHHPDWWVRYHATQALLDLGADGRAEVERHRVNLPPAEAIWQAVNDREDPLLAS